MVGWLFWWVAEDEVGVGAAEAEGADAGQAGGGGGPGLGLGGDGQLGAVEVDVGVEALEVEVGGDGLVLEGEDDFDEAGDAGGGFEVADVGFDGADVVGLPGRAVFVVDGAQGVEFDGVAEGGAGAVGFDVADPGRGQAGVGQGLANDGLLGLAVGCGEAVGAAVLVDG